MNAKIFIKELQKAVRKFERKAAESGEIVDDVKLTVGNGLVALECDILIGDKIAYYGKVFAIGGNGIYLILDTGINFESE
jgi:hypothetical protein